MTTLIAELTETDIRWMKSVGETKRFSPGELVIQQYSPLRSLYLVLEGCLTFSVATDQTTPLGKAFSVLSEESNADQQTLDQVNVGELIGESALLKGANSMLIVRASMQTDVLSLPLPSICAHLDQDLGFAARFYRAIAILLQNRYEKLLFRFSHRRNVKISGFQDGPFLFGELSDGDVDWMVTHGTLKSFNSGDIFQQLGYPIETVYIVLKGSAAIKFSASQQNSLNMLFTQIQDSSGANSDLGVEVAHASRAEILGEGALLNSKISNYTLQAIQPSLLLAVAQPELSIKLQQDLAMASRLYRVVAILMLRRLESLIARLGFFHKNYRKGNYLSDDIQYSNELDLDMMDKLMLGGSRFEWMLRQLNKQAL